ncbi:hypothetical protein [Kordia jejudonensis]|uniref:hypothetical protein n=1 Tax=Kordia jejudonensis TaxID=1348245 RepID=UPI0006293829|nr:hypothetical protein [Kordia jejudonensis]
MNFDYLLPIDSENSNYQFIHLDLDRKFGIACKFHFFDNKTKFIITHTKLVYTCPDGTTCATGYKSISTTKECDSVCRQQHQQQHQKDPNYKYQIKVNIEYDPRPSDAELNHKPENTEFQIKKSGEKLSMEHIIDVKFDKPKNFKNHPINELKLSFDDFVRFGTHFCKFYII